MIIALPVLAVASFLSIVLYRLKLDLEHERSFRAKLSGIGAIKSA